MLQLRSNVVGRPQAKNVIDYCCTSTTCMLSDRVYQKVASIMFSWLRWVTCGMKERLPGCPCIKIIYIYIQTACPNWQAKLYIFLFFLAKSVCLLTTFLGKVTILFHVQFSSLFVCYCYFFPGKTPVCLLTMLELSSFLSYIFAIHYKWFCWLLWWLNN